MLTQVSPCAVLVRGKGGDLGEGIPWVWDEVASANFSRNCKQPNLLCICTVAMSGALFGLGFERHGAMKIRTRLSASASHTATSNSCLSSHLSSKRVGIHMDFNVDASQEISSLGR